jgi:hypothetical protein
MNKFQELTDFLDKYDVKYIIHSDCVEVKGDLYLKNNNLTSLPESFGNLKIGGNLWLNDNNLTSLPESFGNLKIGFSLWLHYNNLASLPESFGNLKIGGYLCLNNNNLASLPESFGNLKIGDNLLLDYNKLESLPESFGNLKIGGNLLCLDNNKLKFFPSILRMNQTIEEDWCYLDDIVREIVSKKTLGELTIIKTPFDYIVGKDNTWAHGRTIKEATQDYHFKLMKANPDALKDIDLDKPLSHEEAIDIYRAVTRACREGIRQWMSGKTFPEQITIREIINLTQSAYGGKEFKQFFLP